MLMRMAIVTKYLPLTNTKPSRVKAISENGSITLSWDNALNSTGNHSAAAKALAEKFGWSGAWYAGSINSGGYVFVCVDSRADDGLPVFETARANV